MQADKKDVDLGRFTLILYALRCLHLFSSTSALATTAVEQLSPEWQQFVHYETDLNSRTDAWPNDEFRVEVYEDRSGKKSWVETATFASPEVAARLRRPDGSHRIFFLIRTEGATEHEKRRRRQLVDEYGEPVAVQPAVPISGASSFLTWDAANGTPAPYMIKTSTYAPQSTLDHPTRLNSESARVSMANSELLRRVIPVERYVDWIWEVGAGGTDRNNFDYAFVLKETPPWLPASHGTEVIPLHAATVPLFNRKGEEPPGERLARISGRTTEEWILEEVIPQYGKKMAELHSLGVLPAAHTQNTLLLVDRTTGKVTVKQRDMRDIHFDPAVWIDREDGIWETLQANRRAHIPAGRAAPRNTLGREALGSIYIDSSIRANLEDGPTFIPTTNPGYWLVKNRTLAFLDAYRAQRTLNAEQHNFVKQALASAHLPVMYAVERMMNDGRSNQLIALTRGHDRQSLRYPDEDFRKVLRRARRDGRIFSIPFDARGYQRWFSNEKTPRPFATFVKNHVLLGSDTPENPDYALLWVNLRSDEREFLSNRLLQPGNGSACSLKPIVEKLD